MYAFENYYEESQPWVICKRCGSLVGLSEMHRDDHDKFHEVITEASKDAHSANIMTRRIG